MWITAYTTLHAWMWIIFFKCARKEVLFFENDFFFNANSKLGSENKSRIYETAFLTVVFIRLWQKSIVWKVHENFNSSSNFTFLQKVAYGKVVDLVKTYNFAKDSMPISLKSCGKIRVFEVNFQNLQKWCSHSFDRKSCLM